jgi:hypothetical protein
VQTVTLGGQVISMLAAGPKDRGFKPSQERWIFKGSKKHDFLQRGSKAYGSMLQDFMQC